MKDLLKLMAQYNQMANKQMYDILEKQDAKLLEKETGSFFKNILGILNHILTSDLGWFNAYRDSELTLPGLKNTVLDYENPGWGKNLYENFKDLKEHREQIDRLIIDFVEETDETVFKGEIKLTRPDGKSVTFIFGKVLLHLFNHQTHHRGAISQILDKEKVENDFSNLIQLLI